MIKLCKFLILETNWDDYILKGGNIQPCYEHSTERSYVVDRVVGGRKLVGANVAQPEQIGHVRARAASARQEA